MRFECVEVCCHPIVRCQSKVNCNSQVLLETRELVSAMAAARGRPWRIRADDSDVKMTRFWNRVYLFTKRHVKLKDYAIRLRAEELTGIISFLRDKCVRSVTMRRYCFVPMRRPSVFQHDDLDLSNLFKIIQERMSVKVMVSVSRHRAEFVGPDKLLYSWVS